MKNFNSFLLLLFLLTPLFVFGQKRTITAISASGDGNMVTQTLNSSETYSFPVTVNLNASFVGRSPSDFTFPEEGELNAAPCFLVARNADTGEIIAFTPLNGKTFTLTSDTNNHNCEYYERNFTLGPLTFDSFCPNVHGIIAPNFEIGVFQSGDYMPNPATSDWTITAPIFTPFGAYMSSLFGVGDQGLCIDYGVSNFSESIDLICGAVPRKNSIGSINEEVHTLTERAQQLPESLDKETEIIISPNPFTNNITLDNLPTNTAFSIKAFDSKGMLIENLHFEESANSRYSIASTNWSPGFYILKLETVDDVKIFKMLKH